MDWNALMNADDLVVDYFYLDKDTSLERIDKVMYTSAAGGVQMQEQYEYEIGTKRLIEKVRSIVE